MVTNVTTVTTPITNSTEWATALLKQGGYPVTPPNVDFLVAWAGAEGGNWNNTAAYNPLNTTLGGPRSGVIIPGSKSINYDQVQAYTSWEQGIAATLSTLAEQPYSAINGALHKGNAVSSFNSGSLASQLSTWGSSVSLITKNLTHNVPNPDQGAALTGGGLLGGLTSPGALGRAGTSPAPADETAQGTPQQGAAAPGAPAATGIEADVRDDLKIAAYLLGGLGGVVAGLYLLVKRAAQLEEAGWLLLSGGLAVLWSVGTQRDPLCVLKAAVGGTDTSACKGTITGGNLFAGTLTALAALYAGSALIKGVGGGGGSANAQGGAGEEKPSEEPPPEEIDPAGELAGIPVPAE